MSTDTSGLSAVQANRSPLASTPAVLAYLWAGWAALPPGRPRRLYALTWWATIGTIFTTDMSDDPYLVFVGDPTVWTVVVGALAVFLWVRLITLIIAIRHGRYGAAPATPTVALAPLPETFVEDMSVPEPPFTAQVVVTPPQGPPATSKLIIPVHTQRRVRRGGETLSGVPIKDRRIVDPRTL